MGWMEFLHVAGEKTGYVDKMWVGNNFLILLYILLAIGLIIGIYFYVKE